MGKIGIIGQGYVGSAIRIGFEPHYEVSTYDKYDLAKSTHSKLFRIYLYVFQHQ